MSHHRQILVGMTRPHPAVILVEGHVQHPMQAVLDAPVASRRCQQCCRVRRIAANVVTGILWGTGTSVPSVADPGHRSQGSPLPERDALGFIPIKPDTPTVGQEGSTAVVAWHAVAGDARSYTLLRSDTPCGREGCRRQFTIDATQTSYRDTTLRPGVNYTYRVQAHYDDARTYFSDVARLTAAAVAVGVPGQPTELTGRYRGSAGTMELNWTAPDPADDVRNYRLYRCAWAT